jgi:hypothetical protein
LASSVAAAARLLGSHFKTSASICADVTISVSDGAARYLASICVSALMDQALPDVLPRGRKASNSSDLANRPKTTAARVALSR